MGITGSGVLVTFEPGARSAWHIHPAGQRLVVTSGVGRVQKWGKPIQVIRAGGCGVVPAGGEALAWSWPRCGNDAPRRNRRARWSERELVGEGDRCPVPTRLIGNGGPAVSPVSWGRRCLPPVRDRWLSPTKEQL